jgi:hypothetical protein
MGPFPARALQVRPDEPLELLQLPGLVDEDVLGAFAPGHFPGGHPMPVAENPAPRDGRELKLTDLLHR